MTMGESKRSDPSEKNNNPALNEAADRNRIVIRTSLISILANVFLAAFKAFVGIVSNSIAVILDSVNNLSDALSSVITIAGTKLAGKRPDRKHPLGYGRIEYLSAFIVAGIILYAGITSFVESVKKIISPEKADYSTVSLIIIAVAVLVKLFLGHFVKKQGIKANSQALQASGSDATFDAVLSLSVFVSALIFIFTGISLEAYVGVIISGFIIKAGIEMMIETLNDILGSRADKELSTRVRECILKEPDVKGAYDLLINNYGPDKNYASVHVELPDTMTVEDLDTLTRRLELSVYKETGVILTGVGVYSYNTKDDSVSAIREDVLKIVMAHEWALQMHGFYVDLEKKIMRFDVVMSFDIDAKEGVSELYRELGAKYPEYQLMIVSDVDLSD